MINGPSFASLAYDNNEEEDSPREILGGDGSGDSLGRVVEDCEEILSESGERSPADAIGEDAADILHATMVRVIRSGDGRCAV